MCVSKAKSLCIPYQHVDSDTLEPIGILKFFHYVSTRQPMKYIYLRDQTI